MANAKKDENSVSTIIGTLNTDGITPTLIRVCDDCNGVEVANGTTGSDLSDDIAARDENSVPVMLGVSSSDGITPVALYVNSSGQLLIKST